jgi:hypothetical protein
MGSDTLCQIQGEVMARRGHPPSFAMYRVSRASSVGYSDLGAADEALEGAVEVKPYLFRHT